MKRMQRGAALLTAMLTVALVATFAAASLWQQWRSIEVETAERARVQSGWILTGALDWARLLLREDARPGAGNADYLGEPWAVPLQEARLSSFLAAEKNVTQDAGQEVLDAFLSGQIIDLQSLLNVTNLVDNGKVSQTDLECFSRLFDLLGLPQAELDKLVENLRFASDVSANNRSSPMAPLLPQRVEQLVWLGVAPATVAAMEPYVTILPQRTTVNLNTASAEVIFAAVAGLDMAEAQRLVAERQRTHFRTVADAQKLLSGGPAAMPEGQAPVGIATRFFDVRTRLRLDQLVVEEHAVVRRDGVDVTVLYRERGAMDPTAMSQAAGKR